MKEAGSGPHRQGQILEPTCPPFLGPEHSLSPSEHFQVHQVWTAGEPSAPPQLALCRVASDSPVPAGLLPGFSSQEDMNLEFMYSLDM